MEKLRLEILKALNDCGGYLMPEKALMNEVRLAMPKAFGRRVIHPLMPAFLARYPKVDVQLLLDDHARDPISDEVDLVVLATDLYEERLEGDEPEPMRVERVNLRELAQLAQNEQLQTIRDIFSNGVTIWTKPEEVGGDFTHDNL